MMVQDLQARVPAQAGAWVETKVKVEAGWAGHLQQGRAVIVSVQAAGKELLMLQDSLVMQEAVLNVVRK